MNITFKPTPRKSISDTIKNIEDMLSKSPKPSKSSNLRDSQLRNSHLRDTQLRETQQIDSSNQVKIKSVIKDCEDMLSSQRKLEKQSFGLNLTSDFFKAYQPKIEYTHQNQVSRPIMMINQPNVALSTRDIKQNIEELELSKTRFERMKRYILENERMLKLQLEKPTAIFEDFFILPLNYINSAPNRDLKLLSTMSSNQTGLYQQTFFCVKSQNNFIAAEKQAPTMKRGRTITKGKLIALKIFNSFLRKNNFLGINIEPKTIKKMIQNRNPNIKTYYYGFHEDERFNEGTYYEEEEAKTEEEQKEENNQEEDFQEKARLEMEEYARQMKKKRITEKLERNPRVLEVLILFLKQVYFDAAMPFKFKRKKSLTFPKYNFDLPDIVKNYSRKSRKPVKKERNLDIRKLEEARENQLLSTYRLDFFDFSDYPQQTSLDLDVGPDEERPELGNVTLAAPIYKQIKNTDKVHFRWLVLRGFNLYWYRSADHQAAKGIIPLPTKPIQEIMVYKRSMFKLPEGLGRNLTFELKDSGIVWRRLLANQIAFQFYYDLIDKEKLKVSNNLVSFFENDGSTKLDLSDLGIKKMSAYNETGFEGKIEVFFDLLIDALVFHNKLRELNLSKAGVGSGVLQKLIGTLGEGVRNFRLEILNLEKNAMNFQALVALEKYLISDNSCELKILLLNCNDLYDQGIMHLGQTLYNRHLVMLEKKIDKYNLPLQKLGLLNVKMSDQGFFGLINQLEKIHKLNKNKGIIEYVNFLDLNVSENLISENSIKGLCHLLEDFGGFSILEMGKCKKIKGYIFKTLMSVIKDNYSILYLNYEENEIDHDGFLTLLDVLEENFVIRKIKFTLPYSLYERMLVAIKVSYQFFQINE